MTAAILSNIQIPFLNQETFKQHLLDNPKLKIRGVYVRVEKVDGILRNVANIGVGIFSLRKSVGAKLAYFRSNGFDMEVALERYRNKKTEHSYETFAIPCNDKTAAHKVEQHLHKCFNLANCSFQQLMHSQGKEQSSHELFTFVTYPQLIENVTNYLKLSKLPIQSGLILRDYQTNAVAKAINFFCNGGKEFYVLHKPRAGKNITAAQIINDYFDKHPNEPKVVRFISRWPSAFNGFQRDVESWEELSSKINIINTNLYDFDWEELVNLLDTSRINIIMVSMQSLTKHFDDDGNIKPDSKHIMALASIPAAMTIVDEGDSGMRTALSSTVMSSLQTSKELWLSGTDLYAYAKLATPENSSVYTIIEEAAYRAKYPTLDVPVVKAYLLDISNIHIPADEQEHFDELVEGGWLSRKLRNVFIVNEYEAIVNAKIECIAGVYYANNQPISFKLPGTIRNLMTKVLGTDPSMSASDSPASFGLNHGAGYLPSRLSLYALANLLVEKPIFIDGKQVKVLVANETIGKLATEQEVVNEIERNSEFHTLYVTVNMLSRGGTVPAWEYVLRLDDGIDWKTGHQKDLRCQSNRKRKEVYVFDANPVRAIMARYEMALVISRFTGSEHDEVMKQMLKAAPLLAYNGIKYVQIDFSEAITIVQNNISIDSLSDDDVIKDDVDITKIGALLGNLGKSSKHEEVRKSAIDGGKTYEPSENDREPVTKKLSDRQMLLYRNNIKAVVRSLALLVWLTDGKVHSINALVNAIDEETKDMWLKHIGITDKLLLEVIEVIDHEVVNSRLHGISEKIRNGAFTIREVCELTKNTLNGDVPLTPKLVSKVLNKFPLETWKTLEYWLDVGTYNGELISQVLERYIDIGKFTKDEVLPYLYVADSSLFNLLVTQKRVGLDKDHLLQYSDDNKKLEKSFQELSMPPFKNIVGNPPYSYGLHMKFLALCHKLLADDGQLVFIQPSTNFITLKDTKIAHGEATKQLANDIVSLDLINANAEFNARFWTPCSITKVVKGYDKEEVVVTNVDGSIVTFSSLEKVNLHGNEDVVFSFKEKLQSVECIQAKRIDKSKSAQSKQIAKEQMKNFDFIVDIAEIRGNTGKSQMLSTDFFTMLPRNYKVKTNEEESYNPILFGFHTKQEAENFVKYLKTNFARKALSLFKFNPQLDRGELAIIPWLDFSQKWTDEKLAKHFNLTIEEIAFVNSIPAYYD